MPVLIRWLRPIIAVSIASLIAWLLFPLARGAPTLLLFSSVLITSWQDGLAGGLISAALAIVALNAFFIPPFGFSLRPEELLETFIFAVFAVVTSKVASDRRRAQRRIVAANEQLENKVAERTAEIVQANRQLQEFARGISHDLREPLRMVTAYSQLLARRGRDGHLDAGELEMLDYISAGGQRMDRMIADLLTYSTALQSQIPLSEVDVRRVIETALQNLRTSILESAATVSFDSLPHVKGVESELIRLFQNLIGNALKYRKPHTPPHIRISAQRQGPEWLFTIADNGVGFKPELSETIFGVFKRLHQNEASGTGVGLALCRRIAEQHGGRIWANGRHGEGATFYFTLTDADA